MRFQDIIFLSALILLATLISLFRINELPPYVYFLQSARDAVLLSGDGAVFGFDTLQSVTASIFGETGLRLFFIPIALSLISIALIYDWLMRMTGRVAAISASILLAFSYPWLLMQHSMPEGTYVAFLILLVMFCMWRAIMGANFLYFALLGLVGAVCSMTTPLLWPLLLGVMIIIGLYAIVHDNHRYKESFLHAQHNLSKNLGILTVTGAIGIIPALMRYLSNESHLAGSIFKASIFAEADISSALTHNIGTVINLFNLAPQRLFDMSDHVIPLMGAVVLILGIVHSIYRIWAHRTRHGHIPLSHASLAILMTTGFIGAVFAQSTYVVPLALMLCIIPAIAYMSLGIQWLHESLSKIPDSGSLAPYSTTAFHLRGHRTIAHIAILVLIIAIAGQNLSWYFEFVFSR